MLGDPQGKIKSLIVDESGINKRVTGIKTFDNKEHLGDLVIVAGEKRHISGLFPTDIIPRWCLVRIDYPRSIICS